MKQTSVAPNYWRHGAGDECISRQLEAGAEVLHLLDSEVPLPIQEH
jgi:hypothetical protein